LKGETPSHRKAGEGNFRKPGAEFLRMSRFHTGMRAGEWVIVTRYEAFPITPYHMLGT
jgi:hypothetical protein